MTTFKERLVTGETLNFFALARLIHPIAVEMYSLRGGFDGFWVDLEHSQATADQLRAVFMTARANGMGQFVRMAPTGYHEVTQYLELGAEGVMAAQIHNADQAAEFTSWAKFPPQGIRGMNTGGADCGYTTRDASEFYAQSNSENFVAIQIETLGSLEQANQIAALDGVDQLFVGPSDLSIALEVYPDFHSEKLWDAVAAVAASCKEHGKSWGAVAPDPAWAERAAELGCQLISMSNEVVALKQGVDAIKGNFDGRF
ncbi:MAG: host specificity protein [Planctomycetaceae bacterium]|nr:host specificity protein [Planctomycetaceae bacterium]MBT4012735.1 host specificity protein [Planctomycetaceae bacterium]MBT4724397.1 host specificity protein [Planctomycetaceae bacterium]MBT4846660.1 host specificity protein [Planctomycetaceae bacterium]MBT5125838.1 host specificity protein [Planctomycetaceae bacterium]